MERQEKRKYKRAYFKFSGQCRGANFWQHVEVKDISCSGAFIATEKTEPVKTKVDIVIEIDQKEAKFVRTEAEVIWARPKALQDARGNILPAGMGLKFAGVLSVSAQEFIEQLIKKER